MPQLGERTHKERSDNALIHHYERYLVSSFSLSFPKPLQIACPHTAYMSDQESIEVASSLLTLQHPPHRGKSKNIHHPQPPSTTPETMNAGQQQDQGSRKIFPFLKLPGELRNKVYKAVAQEYGMHFDFHQGSYDILAHEKEFLRQGWSTMDMGVLRIPQLGNLSGDTRKEFVSWWFSEAAKYARDISVYATNFKVLGLPSRGKLRALVHLLPPPAPGVRRRITLHIKLDPCILDGNEHLEHFMAATMGDFAPYLKLPKYELDIRYDHATVPLERIIEKLDNSFMILKYACGSNIAKRRRLRDVDTHINSVLQAECRRQAGIRLDEEREQARVRKRIRDGMLLTAPGFDDSGEKRERDGSEVDEYDGGQARVSGVKRQRLN